MTLGTAVGQEHGRGVLHANRSDELTQILVLASTKVGFLQYMNEHVEIVLIRDGAVPECLQEVIDSFLKTCPVRIKYIPFEKNGGLGNALRVGVESSTNELIARMDTDDISVSSRFELQLNAFEKDPTLDLVGGQVLEFENDVSDV